jgi:hypothetical protein
MKYTPEEPPASGLVADGDTLMREFNRALGVVYNDVDNNNIVDRGVSVERIVDPANQWEESTSIFGTPPDDHYPTGYTGFAPTAQQLSRLHAVHQDSAHTLDKPGLGEGGHNEDRPHGEYWETIPNLSLNTVTLQEATELNVYASGQITTGYDNSAPAADFKYMPRTCAFDVRIIDKGTPTGDFVTVSTMTYGYVPFLVVSRRLFLPGTHSFEVQVKDKSGPALAWTLVPGGASTYAWMPVMTDALRKPPNDSVMAASQVSNTIIAAIGFVR